MVLNSEHPPGVNVSIKGRGSGGRRLPSRKPRSGITRVELSRLIDEVGGDEVRRVMRALDLPIELDIPIE